MLNTNIPTLTEENIDKELLNELLNDFNEIILSHIGCISQDFMQNKEFFSRLDGGALFCSYSFINNNKYGFERLIFAPSSLKIFEIHKMPECA